MDSNKSFAITLSLIIIIILSLGFYYFFVLNGNSLITIIPWIDSNKTNNKSSNGINTIIDYNVTNNTKVNNNDVDNSVKLSVEDNYKMFFTVNSILNNYYENMVNNNYKELIGMLDESYVSSHNINGNTIKNLIKSGYQSITYYSKEMYVKKYNSMSYYFVKGEEQLYKYIDGQLLEQEDVCYIVILDIRNETFGIIPITTSSLLDYAKNYKISINKRISSSEYNIYNNYKYNDMTICSYYINYFKTMLFLNSQKAYDMLESNYKSSYNDFEDFSEHLIDIYNNLSPVILSYSIEGENGKREYSIIMDNDVRIDIYEKSILDFNISLSNNG